MKRDKLRYLLSVLLMTACVEASAVGDPVAISVTGNVVASPCVVDPDTKDKTIDFDKIYSKDLSEAGTGSVWKDFSLLVKQCPAATTKAKVTFSGTPDQDDATAFETTGEATNVALRLASRDHAVNYGNGSVMEMPINSSDHTATFPLSARLFTPNGAAGAGSFETTVSLTFTYQ